MINFPVSFEEKTVPLPLYKLKESDRQLAQQLADKGYEVHIGLTPEFTDAIAKVAKQPSIREYCANDSAERFKNRESAQRWLTKGRAVFLLLRRTDNKNDLHLAGYGWSGRATSPHVPGGETTFALRVSETDQGHGLAIPFARLIVNATAAFYGAPHIWLETWASNTGAVHIYHKLGFQTVAKKPAQRPKPDGSTAPDTRLYMTQLSDLRK